MLCPCLFPKLIDAKPCYTPDCRYHAKLDTRTHTHRHTDTHKFCSRFKDLAYAGFSDHIFKFDYEIYAKMSQDKYLHKRLEDSWPCALLCRIRVDVLKVPECIQVYVCACVYDNMCVPGMAQAEMSSRYTCMCMYMCMYMWCVPCEPRELIS
jgi:hypothetical protein